MGPPKRSGEAVETAVQPAESRPQWRRPLIAATISLALAALALMLGYDRMRDDAQEEAAGNGALRGGALMQATASDPAAGRDRGQPAPAAQPSGGQSQ